MANLEKLDSDDDRLTEEEMDELFEIRLRPMKSKNARTIYMIFIDQRPRKELTTLDIQSRLVQDGISLSKKEINAWLKSLQSANLISKDDNRGKPTTIQYDRRYTFDLWSLTREGIGLYENLETLLKKGDRTVKEDLGECEEFMTVEKYLLLSMINSIWTASDPLKTSDLLVKLTPKKTTLDEIISSVEGLRYLEKVSKPESGGIVKIILDFLGFDRGDKGFICLTKEGMSLAESLWRKKG